MKNRFEKLSPFKLNDKFEWKKNGTHFAGMTTLYTIYFAWQCKCQETA